MRRFILSLGFLVVALIGCVTTGGTDQGPAFASDDDFRSWFAFYYKDPHPERLTASLRYMKQHAYLDEYPDIASMFLSRVMTANPGELDRWVNHDWQDLGGAEWSVILVSLWMVDTPASRTLMERNLDRADEAHRERIKGLRTRSPAVIDPLKADVVDPRQVNLVWAAFSATGDERYVRKIIDLVHHYGEVTDEMHAAIGEAAIMTLANNTLQHEVVAKLCNQLDSRHPDPKTRILLQAMLHALADVKKDDGPGLPAH